VRRGDGDAARLLFRRAINLVVGLEFAAELLRHHLGDRRRQRRLAMVHVANRPHVHVRLAALKFFFGHRTYSILFLKFNQAVKSSGCFLDDGFRDIAGASE
jgi:hypothetical protein